MPDEFFYSAAEGAFFTRDIHGENMPADAVAISAARHAELLEGQASGMAITAGANGPELTQPAAPPRRATINGRSFRARLTDEERMAWTKAADAAMKNGDPLLRTLMEDAVSDAPIFLDGPMMTGAMQQLVHAGAFTEQRSHELRA